MRRSSASRPAARRTFTDEAALLEACRIPVHAIPGDPMNLKVTHARRPRSGRAGAARPRRDRGSVSAMTAHPFGPGEPLALGGIRSTGAPRLHGHSDGDVVLHAVADALLGAAGLGDLGRVFPAGPATPSGHRQRRAARRGRPPSGGGGLPPARVDLTSSPLDRAWATCSTAMRAAIAGLLGLPVDRVNVKASTGNLAGSEGAGRGIAARAVAVVEPIR